MTATCDLCGAESLDLHTFERCGDCCLCREDLAGELLTIAETVLRCARWSQGGGMSATSRELNGAALALTQIAARLTTEEAGR